MNNNTDKYTNEKLNEVALRLSEELEVPIELVSVSDKHYLQRDGSAKVELNVFYRVIIEDAKNV